MNVLIACEESQRVCTAFRERGHNAFSCDIQPCSGGHPEWHIQGNVLLVLNPDVYKDGVSRYGIRFTTANGEERHIDGKWDLIIAHPPCTYLTVTGNRWFNIEKYGDKALERYEKRESAADFFMNFANALCEKMAIENPIGVMSTLYRRPDQIIQPYWFGDHARKSTCLWLRGLKPLKPTDMVDPGEIRKGGFSVGASLDMARDENGKILPWNDPETARIRSRTFPGIARAMAEQWG